jgi:zinc-ribbon domain
MSFCDQCGSSLQDGDEFCTTCGAEVAPFEALAEPTETYGANTYTEQSPPASLAFTPPPEMTGGISSSSESELPTDPTKPRSRKVLLLISTAVVVYFGAVTFGIVHATTDSPSKETSSLAVSPSKTTTTTTAPTTTTTIAPTTTTQPSRTSHNPGFSPRVPALLRASILTSQPNLVALDTYVSIVDDPSYPSWVEVCAQDAGPTSPGAAKGYANEVDGQWNFTGLGTVWVPPFPLDLTQTIVHSFGACP